MNSTNESHAPSADRPWRTAAFVAGGGALGALTRYAIITQFPAARDGFPAGTLVVNGLGSLLLGMAIGWFESPAGARAPSWLRPMVLAGFLGAFTTLSLVVVDHMVLISAGRGLEALVFGLVTVIGTVVIASCGIAIGARVGRARGSNAR